MRSQIKTVTTPTGEVRTLYVWLKLKKGRTKIYLSKKWAGTPEFHRFEAFFQELATLRARFDKMTPSLKDGMEWVRTTDPGIYEKLVAAGVVKGSGVVLLEDVAAGYFSSIKPRYAEATYSTEQAIYRKLMRLFPGNLADYTSVEVYQTFQSLPNTKRSKQRYQAVLRNVYTYLMECRLVTHNPCDMKIKSTISDKTRSPYTPSRQYISSLILHCKKMSVSPAYRGRKGVKDRWAALLLCSVFGPRTSELRHITPDNVRGNKIIRHYAKQGQSITIRMTPEQKYAIEQVQIHNPEWFSIQCQRTEDSFVDYLQYLLKKIKDDKGRRLTVQSLRRLVSIELTHLEGVQYESLMLSHSPNVARTHYLKDKQYQADLV